MPDADTGRATIRVLIVDDEPLARDCMRLALAADPGVQVVCECGDGNTAIDLIHEHAPDVVLLDVQMPGLDGFGVIERIGARGMPPVVFVTAFEAHAIRAFEVHALDYVLKPFEDARLLAAVDRARKAVRERRTGELAQRFEALMHDWHRSMNPVRAPSATGTTDDPEDAPAAPPMGDLDVDAECEPAPGGKRHIRRFSVRADERVRFVGVDEIEWIEADGNYVVLHVGAQTHRIRASLNHVADGLDPARFARVHRSAIVNVEHIREMQRWFGGDYIAILRSGAKVRVSRLRVSPLLRPMA